MILQSSSVVAATSTVITENSNNIHQQFTVGNLILGIVGCAIMGFILLMLFFMFEAWISDKFDN